MCLTHILAGKHNANPPNILTPFQLLCGQRGNELGLLTLQRLSIQSAAPSAAFWPEFQCQIVPIPPISTNRLGVKGSKMMPIEMSSPHSDSTSIHNIGLSCTGLPPPPIHNAANRETTGRANDIDRLCYSSGGLIN